MTSALRRFLSAVCLSLLLFFLGVTPVLAGLETGEVTLSQLEMSDFFRHQVTVNTPWPKQDLKVENFGCRPESVELPAGDIEIKPINFMHSSLLGRKMMKASILVDGREYEQVKMYGDLHLMGEVVLAARSLARHEVITAEDIKLVRRDVTTLDSGFATETDEVVGKRLQSSLRAGAAVYTGQLEELPLVTRGDLVTIVARSGRLTVTSKGRAKGAAALGEMVRVKNLMSRREIFARVVDSGLVEVDL